MHGFVNFYYDKVSAIVSKSLYIFFLTWFHWHSLSKVRQSLSKVTLLYLTYGCREGMRQDLPTGPLRQLLSSGQLRFVIFQPHVGATIASSLYVFTQYWSHWSTFTNLTKYGMQALSGYWEGFKNEHLGGGCKKRKERPNIFVPTCPQYYCLLHTLAPLTKSGNLSRTGYCHILRLVTSL